MTTSGDDLIHRAASLHIAEREVRAMRTEALKQSLKRLARYSTAPAEARRRLVEQELRERGVRV